MQTGRYDLVVVANRLPVDSTVAPDGSISWHRAPGGLVAALEPMMQASDGAWVGWSGSPGLAAEPFDGDGMRLVPVELSAEEVEHYYEGFANGTLWPLYHDVIAPPEFHRHWWEAYRRVNARFARAAAEQAADGALVWVHDYQLQLVPALLRELRPDLRIGFFDHIPFPPLEIFVQLPWRRQVIDGLLGADVVGFQRGGDAANFVRAVRRLTDHTTRGPSIAVPRPGGGERQVHAAAFPISIDSAGFDALARRPQTRERAAQIRRELGDPEVLLLGVDRLDYTKGIRHRIKAFGELVAEGRLSVPEHLLVQVASPSRENVGAYQQLRDDVETLVGRLNGDLGHIGHPAVHYLHQSFPPEEMAALYLAADVMLVTALRDGMNLVAKEYVAARSDEAGALVLSEFTGAADELSSAILVNPHDIDGMKEAFVHAARIDRREARRRMRRLRRRVMEHDVAQWSRSFLAVLRAVPAVPDRPDRPDRPDPTGDLPEPRSADGLDAALAGVANLARAGAVEPGSAIVLVALDFDGTLAPLRDDPEGSRILPDGVAALRSLGAHPAVRLALVSGRDVADLGRLAQVPAGTVLIGSHGAERAVVEASGPRPVPFALAAQDAELLDRLAQQLERVADGRPGAWVQRKPAGVVLHTRTAGPQDAEAATREALELGERLAPDVLRGKNVVELSVLRTDKGTALAQLREELGAALVVFAGDDVTDERGFAALGPNDVTVKVGDGPTAARFRVNDPQELCSRLLGLAAGVGESR